MPFHGEMSDYHLAFPQYADRMHWMNLGETEAAQGLVRAFNASLGISAQAERAMLAGCLLGWGDQLERSPHVQRAMRRPDTCTLH